VTAPGAPGFLAGSRTWALWVLAATIPLATLAAFALSYSGLYHYALTVGEPRWLAVAYPAIIDLPFIAGEVVLFIAALEGGVPGRVRGYAWAVVGGFAVLSVAAQMGYLPVRAGRGLPPAVLAILLGFGLGELKRQAAKHRDDEKQRETVPGNVPAAGKPYRPPGIAKTKAAVGVGQPAAKRVQQFVAEQVKAASNGHGGIPER
jgi:Protein of unknown function (DUF2637)